MNKRNFIKIGLLSTFALPYIGSTDENSYTLSELYDFIEYRGKCRLTIYQKDALKHIHENNRVIFVKNNTLNITELFAGYTAWRTQKEKYHDVYLSPNSTTFWKFQSLKHKYGATEDVRADDGSVTIYLDGFIKAYDLVNLNSKWNVNQYYKVIIADVLDETTISCINKLSDTFKVLYYPEK